MRKPWLKEVGQHKLFAACSGHELDLIDRNLTTLTVREGAELCRQGTTAREFFVVVGGLAAVQRDGQLLAVVGSGSWFGEIGILWPQTRRTATVVSLTRMVLWIADARGARDIMRVAPVVERKLREVARARLDDMDADSTSVSRRIRSRPAVAPTPAGPAMR